MSQVLKLFVWMLHDIQKKRAKFWNCWCKCYMLFWIKEPSSLKLLMGMLNDILKKRAKFSQSCLCECYMII
jgi:hypothetical protein